MTRVLARPSVALVVRSVPTIGVSERPASQVAAWFGRASTLPPMPIVSGVSSIANR